MQMFSAPRSFEQLSNSHSKYFHSFFFFSPAFLGESGNSSFEKEQGLPICEQKKQAFGEMWRRARQAAPQVPFKESLWLFHGAEDLLPVLTEPSTFQIAGVISDNTFLPFNTLYLNNRPDYEASCKLKSRTIPVVMVILSGDRDTSHTTSQMDTGIL